MIIVITNRKGGVGKTTTTAWISVGMAARGYRVGIVDSDSQGNIALNFGMPAANGLYNVLVEDAALSDVVKEIGAHQLVEVNNTGNVFVLPGYHKTAKIASELGGEGQFKFLAMCEQFKAEYRLDYVLVDTQPSITDADGAIYFAADGYILVTEAEKASVDGIVNVYQQIQRMTAYRRQYLNRETRLLGVIPNKVRSTTNCKAALKRLQEDFGSDLWDAIPLATAITEAFSDEHTPFTYPKAAEVVGTLWKNVERLERLCQPLTV